MNQPVPLNFRAVGFTDAAIDYPLSESAAVIMALHSGVRVDQMPPEFFYAPNAGMKEWLDALGETHAAGHPCRDADGRWWTMSRLRGKKRSLISIGS